MNLDQVWEQVFTELDEHQEQEYRLTWYDEVILMELELSAERQIEQQVAPTTKGVGMKKRTGRHPRVEIDDDVLDWTTPKKSSTRDHKKRLRDLIRPYSQRHEARRNQDRAFVKNVMAHVRTGLEDRVQHLVKRTSLRRLPDCSREGNYGVAHRSLVRSVRCGKINPDKLQAAVRRSKYWDLVYSVGYVVERSQDPEPLRGAKHVKPGFKKAYVQTKDGGRIVYDRKNGDWFAFRCVPAAQVTYSRIDGNGDIVRWIRDRILGEFYVSQAGEVIRTWGESPQANWGGNFCCVSYRQLGKAELKCLRRKGMIK
jgi:hypothetical protein